MGHTDLKVRTLKQTINQEICESHPKKLILPNQFPFLQFVVNNSERSHKFQETFILGYDFVDGHLRRIYSIGKSSLNIGCKDMGDNP